MIQQRPGMGEWQVMGPPGGMQPSTVYPGAADGAVHQLPASKTRVLWAVSGP